MQIPDTIFGGKTARENLPGLANRVATRIKHCPSKEISGNRDQVIAQVLDQYGLTPLSIDLDRMELEPPRENHPLFALVPFVGDPDLLNLRPSRQASGGLPRCEVVGNDLRCYLGSATGPTAVTPDQLEEFRNNLRDWFRLHAEEVQGINDQLRETATAALDERLSTLANLETTVSALGLSIRRRPDAPAVRPPPEVIDRRPLASGSTPLDGRPDRYALPPEEYEHILNLIRLGGTSMERASKAFAGWGEEERRHALLMLLNSHYEGRAVAEALNLEGHTDILITHDDLALFVAECKMWNGKKMAGDAVDQLLGYATWRDAHLALVFFVTESDLGLIVSRGLAAVEEHAQFVAWTERGRPSSTEKVARMRWRDDVDHEVEVAVFFFHAEGAPVPSDAGETTDEGESSNGGAEAEA